MTLALTGGFLGYQKFRPEGKVIQPPEKFRSKFFSITIPDGFSYRTDIAGKALR